MIESKDRSGWIGASDVQFVVGNWSTKTWEKWWLQKLGINRDHFDNEYTMAGTHWEHRILESLNMPNMTLDEQIVLEDLRLRVNYDGTTPDMIHECKTYKWEKGFKVPKKYIQQVNLQNWVRMKKHGRPFQAEIVAYGLVAEDYKNYLRDLDPNRRQRIPIQYDPAWVEKVYLPKHMILLDALVRGVFPKEAL